MIELVRRDFVVDVPLQDAWNRLSLVEDWPSWAKHIKAVRLKPAGPLTERSEGAFRLAGGARSTFRMEVYDAPRRWQWVGRFLTVQVHYDHRFEPADGEHTRLIWTVEAEGRGARTLGRIFGAIYNRNLNKAVPNLQAEMRSTPGPAA
jgi:carbon monoxide dehydrogenase subunit G